MMQSNTPATRLSSVPIGTKLKMVGDTMNRTFVLAELRGDGYYELHCNGRLSVTIVRKHDCVTA